MAILQGLLKSRLVRGASHASDHPVYDALRALTAKRHAAVLLTFDRRLHGLWGSERIESTLFAPG
jgi:predicted nucleic acid-binding protein